MPPYKNVIFDNILQESLVAWSINSPNTFKLETFSGAFILQSGQVRGIQMIGLSELTHI